MRVKSSVALPGALLGAIAAFVVIRVGHPAGAKGGWRKPAGLPGRATRRQIRSAQRVIVELKLSSPHVAEGALRNAAAILGQRQR